MEDLIRRLRKSAHKNCPPKYPVEQTLEWEAADALEQLRAEHGQGLAEFIAKQQPLGIDVKDRASLYDQTGVSTVQSDDAQTPPLATHAIVRSLAIKRERGGVMHCALCDSRWVPPEEEETHGSACPAKPCWDAAVAAPGRPDVLEWAAAMQYAKDHQAGVSSDQAEKCPTCNETVDGPDTIYCSDSFHLAPDSGGKAESAQTPQPATHAKETDDEAWSRISARPSYRCRFCVDLYNAMSSAADVTGATGAMNVLRGYQGMICGSVEWMLWGGEPRLRESPATGSTVADVTTGDAE